MSTALLAGVMTLVACSGTGEDLEPPIEPTDLITPSDDEPTEDPDVDDPATIPPEDLPEPLADLVSEPVYPEAATEFTPDGAEAFVHYVIEATNWAFAMGDPTKLVEWCIDDAVFCESVGEQSSFHHEHGWLRYGGDAAVDAVTGVDVFIDENAAVVSATIRVNERIDLEPNGTVADESDTSKIAMTFVLQYQGSSWQLEEAGG